jgi:hypothetical protein
MMVAVWVFFFFFLLPRFLLKSLTKQMAFEKLLAASPSAGRRLYNRNQRAIILPFLVAFRSLQAIDRVNFITNVE